MMKEEYINQIVNEVNASAIKNQSLKDDLIDHICCLVEEHLKSGDNFDVALNKAYEQTCPNGIDEIEKEAIFLINYSKILLLKRITYIIGFIAAASLSIGILMKLIYAPYSNMLLALGAVGLIFLFMPLLLVGRVKKIANKVLSERLKWITGLSSMLVFAFSLTFKMLHLQGAVLLLALSFILFSFGFLPFLFFRMYRKSLDEAVD